MEGITCKESLLKKWSHIKADNFMYVLFQNLSGTWEVFKGVSAAFGFLQIAGGNGKA